MRMCCRESRSWVGIDSSWSCFSSTPRNSVCSQPSDLEMPHLCVFPPLSLRVCLGLWVPPHQLLHGSCPLIYHVGSCLSNGAPLAALPPVLLGTQLPARSGSNMVGIFYGAQIHRASPLLQKVILVRFSLSHRRPRVRESKQPQF